MLQHPPSGHFPTFFYQAAIQVSPRWGFGMRAIGVAIHLSPRSGF